MNTIFEIHFTDRSVLLLEGADAYQPEGAMTTFFASGSTRSTIDSWSTRVASFRSGDINSVQRSSSGASAMVDLCDDAPTQAPARQPALTAVP